MKRIILFLICVVLSFSLCACGSIKPQQDWDSVSQISKNDAKKMVDLVSEIANLEKSNAGQQEIKSYLEELDWVKNVSETEDGGLTCVSEFGVTGVWTPENEDTIGGANETAMVKTAQTTTITSNNSYDVDSIAILCPYASVDSNFNLDGYNYIGETMTKYTDCEVTFFKDEDVSLELLKNLDQFDMVWFYSHGALSNVFNSAWAIIDSDPYTMTGEFASSPEAYILLSSDFFNGRTIVDLSDGRIGVGGNFYNYYYSEKQLDGMFFHFASCNSMRTDKLANGILSRGAAWVEGWDNSVCFDNDYMQFVGVIANLLEDGDNISQAIIDADSLVKNEPYYQNDCKLKGAGDSNYSLKIKVDSNDVELEDSNEGETAIVTDTLENITNAYKEQMEKNGPSWYTFYDMDKNGIPELIIKTGDYEAEYTYEFYSYNNGIVYCGTIGAGHSNLAIPDSENGLWLCYQQMGYSSRWLLTLVDYKVNKSTLFEGREADETEKLDYLQGYPDPSGLGIYFSVPMTN